MKEKKKRNKKRKVANTGPARFELVLANGKSRKFDSSHSMWQWAVQSRPKWDWEYKEKSGQDLCDFFERKRKSKKK
jgi:hypothetical protein